MRRKMILLSVIVLVVAFASLSFKNDEPKFKNLKVLDKNISKDELTIIMKEFKTALGVKCNFCHVESKTNPGKLDEEAQNVSDSQSRLSGEEAERARRKANERQNEA